MTKKKDSFEDRMKKLQNIVDKLEKDDIDLDKSIEFYQEGLELSKELRKELKSFEDKINKINEKQNG